MIPARRSQIPRHETALKWPHLESIAGHLMPLDTEAEIGLLIGANCPRAIKPHKVILGNDDDPYAKRTALGWGIIGEIEPQGQDNSTADVKGDVFCNRIVTCEVRQAIQATASDSSHGKRFKPRQAIQAMASDSSHVKQESVPLRPENAS